MHQKNYTFIVIILGILATVSPFSIDMYLPGFPKIAEDLHTTIEKVQLSLTSYLVGICVGQLLYGPLLDRFGRKKPLYVGLGIYVIASIGCAMTNTVESLILMRFLQAMGGCVGLVASQALVSDLFPVEKRAEIYSLITLVIAVSPMIAPTAGGYMASSLSWHWIFISLALIVACMLVCIHFFLPLGKPADTSVSLKPDAVIHTFFTVLKQPQFLVYAVGAGIATAAPFAYIAGSADVFMNIYKISEQQYGLIFGLLAFAMIGSTQFNHLLLKRFSSGQIIRMAMIYQNISAVVLVMGVWLDWFNIYTLIGVMFIFLTGQGLISPNVTTLALAPFRKYTGSASALLGSWRMGTGAVVSAIVSLLHNATALPMVGMMALCTFIGLITLTIGGKTILNRQVTTMEL